MAQKVNIILVDDLDGSEATETVAFGLDGSEYEIDLNESNATELRDAIAKYVGMARKVAKGKGRSTRSSSSSSSSADKTAIREWAKANGFEVSERGRIPANVQEAYDAAQRDGAPKATGPKGGGRRRTASVDDSGKVKQDA